MATNAPKVSKRSGLSREGAAMDKAFKEATDKARTEAFKVRKTIMIEKDGWLVMVNKEGRVVKRVKRLTGGSPKPQ